MQERICPHSGDQASSERRFNKTSPTTDSATFGATVTRSVTNGDGAGHIATIGADVYTYDRAGRLLSGTVQAAGVGRSETLSYDAADNVTSFARDGGAAVAHNVDASTNRLLGRRGDASILWDAAGSVTRIGRQSDGRPVFLMTNGPFRRQTSFEITDPDPGMPSHYYPFGAEIEDSSAVLLDGFEDGDTRYWLESKDERRVEWTGHERDPHGLTDYMPSSVRV